MTQLLKTLTKNFPNLDTITAMFADSNGMMRGKVLPADALEKLITEGVLLPASVYGTDATGESVAETGLVWDTGDEDFPFHVVKDSFHDLSDGNGTDAACLIQMMTNDGTPHHLDPRSILAKVVDRLNDMGLHPVIAPELEFYLIDRQLDDLGMGQYARIPISGETQPTNQIYGIEAFDEFSDVVSDIRRTCLMAGVRADTAITEYGRGQYEINILHNDDALRAADEAALLRYHARRIARRHGLDTTFMGKPFANDTGSGFHLHVSLWDDKGNNIMAEKDGDDPTSNPLLRYAVGGMAKYLADSFAVFAPNANAWRRMLPGHYAPVDRSWGINNRTVNFRVPSGNSKSRRLEHRASSADINPYLTTALILAAMAEGIKHQISPPEMTKANAYDTPNRDGLPNTWAEAIQLFRDSDFIKNWLGEEYTKVYAATKEYERNTFAANVTALEWSWYR
ncbi:MAG: glutamine synthetase family protein [Proteobacteria bacterium]|nr:glutamine synthetase family protein [Pseudomonadota bacterium]